MPPNCVGRLLLLRLFTIESPRGFISVFRLRLKCFQARDWLCCVAAAEVDVPASWPALPRTYPSKKHVKRATVTTSICISKHRSHPTQRLSLLHAPTIHGAFFLSTIAASCTTLRVVWYACCSCGVISVSSSLVLLGVDNIPISNLRTYRLSSSTDF